MMRSTLALLLLPLALPAAAQTIYKCTDAGGGTLISNARVDKNCKAIVSGPDSSVPAPKPRPAGAAANPTPNGFPKVQEETQKARDNDRRHILEQELAGEQRSLEQARRELADQDSLRITNESNRGERLQPYKDRIAQHERNIQAIQKEIGGMK